MTKIDGQYILLEVHYDASSFHPPETWNWELILDDLESYTDATVHFAGNVFKVSNDQEV